MRILGLGLRVWCLGLMGISGLRFRVWGNLGFRV